MTLARRTEQLLEKLDEQLLTADAMKSGDLLRHRHKLAHVLMKALAGTERTKRKKTVPTPTF